jgi:glycosyltransferase involved in cell wall biosynthesis
MKIAVFLTYNYSLQTWLESGTLQRELELYNKLNNENNVEFTFFSYGNSGDKELLNEFPNLNIVTMRNNNKVKNKFYMFLLSLSFPIKYRDELRNHDVIQQHQLLGSWVAILAKYIVKKPLFVRTGYDMYEFSILSKDSIFRKGFLWLLTKITLSFSDLFTVTSMADKDFLKEKFNFNLEKIKIRPNWIRNNNQCSILERKNEEILTVGRLDKQKNYQELIKMFQKNSKFKLKIIGEGYQEKDLNSLIKSNDLNVSIHKNLDNKKLIKEMNKHKYYISSSLFEGNPKTVLEAMSAGCVVIASDIKNHKEIIKDSENGFLFDLLKFDFLDKLISIESDSNIQKNISKKAVESVITHNHIDVIATKTYADYKLLI